jgi:ABC-type nitrate/sulfonate/bicarbonate transport system substrate-binding protein
LPLKFLAVWLQVLICGLLRVADGKGLNTLFFDNKRQRKDIAMSYFTSVKGVKSAVRLLVLVVVSSGAASVGTALAQTPLRISVQPANYSMLAVHVATKNDFWKLAGLSPTFIRYPAGVPQIKANADWDIGITGAVPALIGAKDFDLITIAVADDQSRTNALMAPKDLVEQVRKEKRIPKGTKIAVTLNSTADYAVQTCLALWGGLTKSDVTYQGATQPEAIQAGASGAAQMVGLWAPNVYTMKEKHGFETLCTAKDFSPGLYNVAIANRSFANKNPDTVAKFLAVMMRAVKWMKDNPAKTHEIFVSTATEEGFNISIANAKNDYEQRGIFDLSGQFRMMGETSAGIDGSAVGRSFYSINVFLNEGRAGTRTMKPSVFIDTSYLKRVKDNPEFEKIANPN